VPATDPHNVLVEEFTGQSCSNCPSAHDLLDAIADSNAGRVNVIGLYITDFGQTTPPPGSTHDFRSDTASVIGKNIYGGVGSLPSGGVDRTPVTGQLLLDRGVWGGIIHNQLNIADSVNLKMESAFDDASSTAKIKATVVYTQPVYTKQNLTVMIVEDSMVDKQERPAAVDDNYTFTNVFRGTVTAVPMGDPILDTMALKVPGRRYIRTYTYKLPSGYNVKNCRVIGYINSPGTGSDYHVWQSWQCRLKP
jgi:hypothetical protein